MISFKLLTGETPPYFSTVVGIASFFNFMMSDEKLGMVNVPVVFPEMLSLLGIVDNPILLRMMDDVKKQDRNKQIKFLEKLINDIKSTIAFSKTVIIRAYSPELEGLLIEILKTARKDQGTMTV